MARTLSTSAMVKRPVSTSRTAADHVSVELVYIMDGVEGDGQLTEGPSLGRCVVADPVDDGSGMVTCPEVVTDSL